MEPVESYYDPSSDEWRVRDAQRNALSVHECADLINTLIAENAQLRDANASVAVCAQHTADVVWTEEVPCSHGCPSWFSPSLEVA